MSDDFSLKLESKEEISSFIDKLIVCRDNDLINKNLDILIENINNVDLLNILQEKHLELILLEDPGKCEYIRKKVVMICFCLFPKNNFPSDFYFKISEKKPKYNNYCRLSFHNFENIFIKYPFDTYCLCAFSFLCFYFDNIYVKNDMELSLACVSSVKSIPDYSVLIIFICTKLQNLEDLARIRYQVFVKSSPHFQKNEIFQKILKKIIHKFPKLSKVETLVASGNFCEILAYIYENYDAIDEVLKNGMIQRAFNVFNGEITNDKFEHIVYLVDLIKNYIRCLNFCQTIKLQNKCEISFKFPNEECNFSSTFDTNYPLLLIEYRYNSILGNVRSISDLASQITGINIYELCQTDVLHVSVINRLYNRDYQKLIFYLDNNVASVYYNLSCLLLFKDLSEQISIIAKAEENVCTSIEVPEPILDENSLLLFKLLSKIHDRYSNIDVVPFLYSDVRIRNEFLKSGELPLNLLKILYYYPFLFTNDLKRGLSTYFSTPFETEKLLKTQYIIDRENFLYSGSKFIESLFFNHLHYSIMYKDSVSFGRGIMTDFLTQLSNEIYLAANKLFLTEEHGEKCYMVNGLWPRFDADPNLFFMMGTLFGVLLINHHPIENNISPYFFEMVNGKTVTFQQANPSLASVFGNPKNLIGLESNFPGIDDVFFDKDKEITSENVSSYCEWVASKYVGEDIKHLAEMFRKGINRIISVNSLSLFTGKEFCSLFSSYEVNITEKDVMTYFKPSGGYSKRSKQIKWLSHLIPSLSPAQQQDLLYFITNLKRLPQGGISKLDPPITVIKKGDDDSLFPSVMTCYHVLKLPAYSNESILQEKLIYAIQGDSDFLLS